MDDFPGKRHKHKECLVFTKISLFGNSLNPGNPPNPTETKGDDASESTDTADLECSRGGFCRVCSTGS